jgi:hypothetical protein
MKRTLLSVVCGMACVAVLSGCGDESKSGVFKTNCKTLGDSKLDYNERWQVCTDYNDKGQEHGIKKVTNPKGELIEKSEYVNGQEKEYTKYENGKIIINNKYQIKEEVKKDVSKEKKLDSNKITEGNDLKYFEKQIEKMKKEIGNIKFKSEIDVKMEPKKEGYYCNFHMICVNGTITYNNEELKLDNTVKRDKEINEFLNNTPFYSYGKNGKFITREGNELIIKTIDESKILKEMNYKFYPSDTSLKEVAISRRFSKDEFETIEKIKNSNPYNRILKEYGFMFAFVYDTKSENMFIDAESDGFLVFKDKTFEEGCFSFIEVKDNKIIINEREGRNNYTLITMYLKNNMISKIIETKIKTESNVGAIVNNETIVTKLNDKGDETERTVYENNVLVKTMKKGE